MKRWALLVAVAVICAVLTAWSGVALGRGGVLVSGEWARYFGSVGTLTPEPQVVTDCAFGPGRLEVAFLGPKGDASALWIASGQALLEEKKRLEKLWEQRNGRLTPEEEELFTRPWTPSPAAPRLLWTAPAGLTLRGPIRWSPNGDTLLVLAGQGETRDLAAVDYVSGEATWFTHGARVEDAAWSPNGKLLTYVTAEGDTRTVWLRAFPAGEPRKLGDGGFDLRWSSDGAALQWLAPSSPTVWAEMTWEAETDTVTKGGERPARPAGTLWSPDGKWCAALLSRKEGAAKQLLLWRAAAATGDVVPLSGLYPKRLLSWSPDSLLLLVQGENNAPYAVNVSPPRSGAVVTTGGEDGRSLIPIVVSRERAEGLGMLFASEAGPPAWSSDGVYFAYSCTDPTAFTLRRHTGLTPPEHGRLVMMRVIREHVTVHEKLTPELERVVVLSNVKNVVTALNMYLADYNGFPLSNNQQEMIDLFEDYVKTNDVYLRPGSEDVVVRWVFDPTKRLEDIEDYAREEAVIVDYSPDFYVVGYVDGHARAFNGKRP